MGEAIDMSTLENTKIKIDTDLATIKRLIERYKSDPAAVQKLREDPIAALLEFGITLDKPTSDAIKGAAKSAPHHKGLSITIS
jgi:hypothetical protein